MTLVDFPALPLMLIILVLYSVNLSTRRAAVHNCHCPTIAFIGCPAFQRRLEQVSGYCRRQPARPFGRERSHGSRTVKVSESGLSRCGCPPGINAVVQEECHTPRADRRQHLPFLGQRPDAGGLDETMQIAILGIWRAGRFQRQYFRALSPSI